MTPAHRLRRLPSAAAVSAQAGQAVPASRGSPESRHRASPGKPTWHITGFREQQSGRAAENRRAS
jgi:hypothetical protein